MQIAEETLRNYQQSYAFVEKQLLTGSSNVVLEQARGVIESTRSDIAKRQGELAQANNALQLLLGSYGKLPDGEAATAAALNHRRACAVEIYCSARILWKLNTR
ncbi:hypothetical protein ACLK17_03075 [Escherichia coli]